MWETLSHNGADVGIPHLDCWNSNLFRNWSGTLSGGQFDWGGRLRKSNGAQIGNRALECKRASQPNCEGDGPSSNERGGM